MRQIYLLLLMLVLVSGTSAQPYIDLVSAYYSHSPGKGLDESNTLRRFDHFRAQLNVPIVFKKDSSVLLINPVVERRYISLDESVGTKSLNGMFMLVSFTKKLNDRWSVMLGGIPRWNGESSVPTDEKFQIGGVAWVTRTIHPQLKIRAGLYYNREFFGNFFMPVVGIEWKINKNSYLFGNLPSSLVYENRLNNFFSLGAVFRTFPNSYKIVPLTAHPENDYYRTTDIQLGIFTDFYLAKKIVLNIEGGYSVSRTLRNGDEDGGGRDTEITLSDKGNYYMRASLQYRLRFY
jgi:hypothetical protein